MTREEKTKGLMFRQTLKKNHGMLFVFEKPASRAFWMKNTYIPLDIIFLDNKFKVLAIRHGKPLDLIYIRALPGQLSQYVLELNHGQAKTIGLSPGDILTLDFERL